MTDDDLLETVRSGFAEVRLGTPVAEVIARGQELRRGRRLLAGAGTGAGVLAVATGLALGLGASSGAPAASPVALDGWSVSTQPNHTVTLTIRDRHLTGPDRRHMSYALKAAGVPALVVTRQPRCGRTFVVQAVPAPVPYRPFPRSKSPVPAAKVSTFKLKLSRIGKGAQVVIVIPKYGTSVQGAAPPPRLARSAGRHRPGSPVVEIAPARSCLTIVHAAFGHHQP